MNPYRLYRDEWASTLAGQASAARYKAFVAMPFREHFSYRATVVLNQVLIPAIRRASRRRGIRRPFADPRTVDVPGGATSITDDIVRGIIECHVFIADVTFQNAGVLLETGIALGTKPAEQVILITQGSPAELHFDLRNNRVVQYSPTGNVAAVTSALVKAAQAFEINLDWHVSGVTKRISPDALVVLNQYGQIHRRHAAMSLHPGTRGTNFDGDQGLLRFEAALRELRDKDLVWTDYKPKAVPGGDAFGTHATEFGWLVIERMWPELQRSTAAPNKALQPTSRNKAAASARRRTSAHG